MQRITQFRGDAWTISHASEGDKVNLRDVGAKMMHTRATAPPESAPNESLDIDTTAPYGPRNRGGGPTVKERRFQQPTC